MTMNEKKALATRIFLLELIVEEGPTYDPWPGDDFYKHCLYEAHSLYELLTGTSWHEVSHCYNKQKKIAEDMFFTGHRRRNKHDNE